MRFKLGLLVCTLLALCLRAQAQRTIHVPADQPTIQAGINAANTGDTVLVAPGTYNENIDFKGKAITVTSSGGAAVTTIDGQQKAPAVVFSTSETRASTLSGFTVQHGGLFNYISLVNGGIFLHGSSPTITNDVLTKNNCWTIFSSSSAPLIQNNVISATQDPQGQCSFGGGAGIYVGGNLNGTTVTNDGTSAMIVGNTIENNVESGLEDAGGNGGAGIAVWGGSPIILNNTIRNNSSPGGSGGAINVQAGFGVAIVQNLIYGNFAGCGGGALAVQANQDSRTGIADLVANNTIANNTGASSGGFSECDDISQIYPAPDSYGSGNPADLFINNVISGSTSAPAINCALYGERSESSQPAFENDILYNAGGPFFGSYCVDVSGEYDNIAADPQFVNTSTGDFHLRNTSPAIDHGQNAILQIFQNLTGLTLATDFDGNARVQGTTGKGCAIDMGAYEYPGSKATCGTTETLVSSLNPSTFGQTVTLTAQLSSANGVPTGDVQFSDGSTVLGTETISPTGVSTFSTSALSVGSHSITGAYQPTGSFPAATASLTQVVNGAATTTTITSSLNPSSYGAPVTFSAQVVAAAASTNALTGTVTFTDGNTILGTATINSSGNAAVTTAALAANAPGTSHLITATYNPNGSFAASSATLTQVVNGLPTVVSLNPVPASITAGQPVTLNTTVTPANPPGPAPLTGTVTYFEGSVTLGSAPVGNNGVAGFSASNLRPGQNTITCTYSGDAIYAPSTCAPATVTVTGPVIGIHLSATPNPAFQGQAVTLTATFLALQVNAQVPAETFTFFDGSTALGSAPLSASGQATLTTTTLAVGTHALTATYNISGNLTGYTSAVVQETILPSAFAIALSPSTLNVVSGQQGTVAIALTSVGGFSGPLTLTYGPLPAYTSGTLTPATVTLTAGASASASLLLNTAVAANTIPDRPGSKPGTKSWPLALSALLLLPLSLSRSRRLRLTLITVFAAVLLQTLTGCTTIRVPFDLAPAGTYQVPVTATDSNGNQHAATLTVVVTPR